MVRKALLRNGILATRNIESEDCIEVCNKENKEGQEIKIYQLDKEPIFVYSIEHLLETISHKESIKP